MRGFFNRRQGEAPAEPQLWMAAESTLAAQRELRPAVGPAQVRRESTCTVLPICCWVAVSLSDAKTPRTHPTRWRSTPTARRTRPITIATSPRAPSKASRGDELTSEQTANTEVDATGPAQEDSLAGAYDLQDQRGHPVLLVFAGSPEVPEYEKLKTAWRDNSDAMKQQNVALVESLLKGKSPNAGKTLNEGESQVLRSRYGIQPAQFKVILIDAEGKTIDEWEDEEATFDAVQKALQK